MGQKNLSRRDFLQMGALTAAGATLAACGGATPTPQVVEKVVEKQVTVEKEVTVEKQVTVKETVVVQATPAPAEVVEITFMGWGDVAEDEGVRSAITVFQGAEPDIKVTWMHTPDAYIEKLLAMVAAGTPPDTAFVNNQTFLTYVHEKMLLDITDMLKADKVVGAPGYFIEPQETNRCTYQGKWYGIGACWTGSHIYYNADIFDKAGVKPPSNKFEEAWKWDDFINVAKQLTVDTKGKHPGESGFDANNIDRWGVYWDVWWMHLLAAIRSNEGEFVDPKTQLLALDQPAAAEALQALADLRLVHQVAPAAATFDQLGMTNTQMLENGKLAMAVDGSWALSWMCKIQATLGTAVLPMLKVAATGLQSHLHSAFVGTKHPQEAWRWLRFLATEYYQLQFLRMGLWLPSQTALMTEEGLKKWIIPRKSATEGVHPDGYDLIATQYVPKCGNILYQPAGYQKASAIFTPALDAIWTGDKKAAEAMAEVVPQANDVLKQEAAS